MTKINLQDVERMKNEELKTEAEKKSIRAAEEREKSNERVSTSLSQIEVCVCVCVCVRCQSVYIRRHC